MSLDEHQRNQWGALVKSAFASDAEVNVTPGTDDFKARVSWLLPTKDRPNKRSKTIRLTIPREAILDSANKDESRREQDRQKVEKWIRNNLESLDASHDSPSSQETPEVIWKIGSDVLNG